MTKLPVLETERLLLTPVLRRDITCIVKHASNKKISDTTLNIPYPYRRKDAIVWLRKIKHALQNKTGYTYAIRLKEHKKFVGAISLKLDNKNKKAEMGYWIAEELWNKGYTSEAASAIINFGFTQLNMNKIFATHLKINPASGRVMINCGMQWEAEMKEHILANNTFCSLIQYRITKNDFLKNI